MRPFSKAPLLSIYKRRLSPLSFQQHIKEQELHHKSITLKGLALASL
jgi:hypothetical protein